MSSNRGYFDSSYRGKTKSNEWVYGSLLKREIDGKAVLGIVVDGVFSSDNKITSEWHEVIPSSVCKATFHTDMYGLPVYEKDLLKHHFGKEIGVVTYGTYMQSFGDDKFTKHIGFYVDWIKGEGRDCLRKDLGYWLNLGGVLGNILDTDIDALYEKGEV